MLCVLRALRLIFGLHLMHICWWQQLEPMVNTEVLWHVLLSGRQPDAVDRSEVGYRHHEEHVPHVGVVEAKLAEVLLVVPLERLVARLRVGHKSEISLQRMRIATVLKQNTLVITLSSLRSFLGLFGCTGYSKFSTLAFLAGAVCTSVSSDQGDS